MKIGILGGTFNPVHIAHLRIAEEVRERFELDRVIFVPAATPPHKPLAGDLPFAIRHRMVSMAIAGNPSFTVSEIEGKRAGKSYSIDTIHAFREEYPDDELSSLSLGAIPSATSVPGGNTPIFLPCATLSWWSVPMRWCCRSVLRCRWISSMNSDISMRKKGSPTGPVIRSTMSRGSRSISLRPPFAASCGSNARSGTWCLKRLHNS